LVTTPKNRSQQVCSGGPQIAGEKKAISISKNANNLARILKKKRKETTCKANKQTKKIINQPKKVNWFYLV